MRMVSLGANPLRIDTDVRCSQGKETPHRVRRVGGFDSNIIREVLLRPFRSVRGCQVRHQLGNGQSERDLQGCLRYT